MQPGRWLTGLAVLVLWAVAWAWWPTAPAEPSAVSAAPPAGPVDDAPRGSAEAPEDPDELALWYEARVRDALDLETRRHDERRSAAGAAAPRRIPGSAAGAGVRIAREEAPTHSPEKRLNTCRKDEAPPDLAARSGIDWDYLCDIFAGRVTGIPNESRAGLTLPEIDQLGEIPYVEELRADPERTRELRELGFEDETPGWPECMRMGRCRRDPESSPPA